MKKNILVAILLLIITWLILGIIFDYCITRNINSQTDSILAALNETHLKACKKLDSKFYNSLNLEKKYSSLEIPENECEFVDDSSKYWGNLNPHYFQFKSKYRYWTTILKLPEKHLYKNKDTQNEQYISNVVHVTLQIENEWSLYPSQTKVKILDHDAKFNPIYINILKSELEKKHVHFNIEKTRITPWGPAWRGL